MVRLVRLGLLGKGLVSVCGKFQMSRSGLIVRGRGWGVVGWCLFLTSNEVALTLSLGWVLTKNKRYRNSGKIPNVGGGQWTSSEHPLALDWSQ